jgi:hypothetical protein
MLSDIEKNGPSVGSPAEAVEHLPRLSIDDPEVRKKIIHGQPLPATDFSGPVVALVEGDRLLAIAEKRDTIFKPRVVMEG